MSKISTKHAIELIEQSDCVILEGNDIFTVATFAGYTEESDPDSSYVIGCEGWDDIVIERPEWDPKAATLRVKGFVGTITLFTKLKETK